VDREPESLTSAQSASGRTWWGGPPLARFFMPTERTRADYIAWDTLDMLKSGTLSAGVAVREK